MTTMSKPKTPDTAMAGATAFFSVLTPFKQLVKGGVVTAPTKSDPGSEDEDPLKPIGFDDPDAGGGEEGEAGGPKSHAYTDG